MYRTLRYETAVRRSANDAGLHPVCTGRMLRANMILTHGVLHRLWSRRRAIVLGMPLASMQLVGECRTARSGPGAVQHRLGINEESHAVREAEHGGPVIGGKLPTTGPLFLCPEIETALVEIRAASSTVPR